MDTVIAAMEANHPHLTTQKSFYVEISRARDQAELVTDDKAALKEQLKVVTGERIAALEAVELEQRINRDPTPDLGHEQEGKVGASASRDRSPVSEAERQRQPHGVGLEI